MATSKLYRKLRDGKVALGGMAHTSSAELVEVTGYVGLDWVLIDLMTSEVDWMETATMCRAANQFHMTPIVRLPAFPFGTKGYDRHMPVDATRAFAVGAEGVMASISSTEEAAALVKAGLEGITRPYLGRTRFTENGVSGFRGNTTEDGPGTDAIGIPFIESKQGWECLDEILEIPGIQAISFGMGDLSAELIDLHHGDAEVMLALIEEACAKAAAKGVWAFCNPVQSTQADSGAQALRNEYTPEKIAESIARYADAGVNAMYLNPLNMLAQIFLEDSKAAVDAKLGQRILIGS